MPPHKLVGEQYGAPLYRWFITEDEYLRLNKLFGRDFQETGLGATTFYGPPVPCDGCGKYCELIDCTRLLGYTGTFNTPPMPVLLDSASIEHDLDIVLLLDTFFHIL